VPDGRRFAHLPQDILRCSLAGGLCKTLGTGDDRTVASSSVRRITTSKARIAEYWLGTEPGRARLPGNAALMDFGEPSCFACGFMATDPDEPPRLWSVWNRARLQRCHLVPRMLGGADTPENLVLLCDSCHRDAPDVGDPRYMLAWIERRESRFVRWQHAIEDAVEAAGLTAPFHALTREQADRMAVIADELQRTWIGGHGAHLSESTIGAVMVEALRRIGATPSTGAPSD
jgi:5-methylcytosine-specific restriction endonuclease McrA